MQGGKIYMNTLSVEKLNFSYGNNKILKDITFEVNDGLIGILGPNGAGKTTLIKILSTLMSAKEDNIQLNNISYKKDIFEIRKMLGYMPQHFKAYPQLTGMEFLKFIANIKMGKDKDVKDACIKRIVIDLNMEEFINKKIRTYSGGMLQRLGIAQALIGDPKIIIVDEPTAGLDPEQRNNFRKILPIISRNRIVIVTTHIVEDIEYYCDYLILMDKGYVKYKGNISKFLDMAKGKIWKASVANDGFMEIVNNSLILDIVDKSNIKDVVYVSDNKIVNNSLEVEPSLQYTYLYYQNIE